MDDQELPGPSRAANPPSAMRRLAIIFDDKLRPETTGTYCRRALQELVEVEHIRPCDLPRLNALTSQPLHAFDLYLRIDDGLDYVLPTELHPAAWWAIDTHLDFDGCLVKARGFDFVFAAQRDGAERLRDAGIASATWLPLACDPEIHRKHDIPKEFDMCFVGNELPGARAELLRLIQRKFLNTFVGQRYFDEMARTYSASRIVFNRSVRNDINMRVFEGLACGSLLLTNDLADNGQSELFRPGIHLETYRDPDELIDKIRYYIGHEEARERIAAAGRAEVLAKHTYRHRMESILKAVGSRQSTVGNSNQTDNGPGCNKSDPYSLLPTPNSLAFRDRSYFDHLRPELLALVPETARRVLDIGCAAGRLGEAIKARQPAEVTGIEIDESAAADARNRLDRVVVCNVEQLIEKGDGSLLCEAPEGPLWQETPVPFFSDASFDCIICGDILEHLDDTEAVLRRAHGWLAPGGCLVASIPNVRHHSVLRALLDGNWTYESAGLLDRDHVRFFTRKEIERVFHETEFKIDQIQFIPGPGYDAWEKQGRPGAVKIGRLHIGGLSPEEAGEFFVYQFLVVARPASNAELAAKDSNAPIKEKPRGSLVDRSTPDRRHASSRRRMHFTQNFVTDFDQFDLRGEPFAFVRFGDGERAICEGRRVESQDGWTFDGAPAHFAADLNDSLRCNAPDYFIGISDSCCDRAAHEWFLKQITAPLHHLTFANIFVNWNYRRFRQLDWSGFVIVANGGGDFWIPDDLVCGNYDIDGLVAQLLAVDRPILLAAGPASCVIAHKYWLRADPAWRQTIVDVGSAIDERTKGRKTRQYQIPGTRTAELICTW